MNEYTLKGNLVDLVNGKIFFGSILIRDGCIVKITKQTDNTQPKSPYILPGFIDAHIHIESSMMVPSEFARLAVTHGTIATVSDPHEIANVLGIDGVRYMIENGKQVPFHFYFGAPSCVPATSFETAGATLSPEDIRTLFEEDKLCYLSEMMNFPGVLHHDHEVMEKIRIAKELGKPIDGHAPGLKGKQAEEYARAGISTDHECFTLEEAQHKIQCGMKILIREGSAAKNYEALHSLIGTAPDKVMLCSDDKHPNELVMGHIDQLVRRSVAEKGYDVIQVLRCACYNPVKHYGLEIGLLQEGDPADCIVVNNLQEFTVKQTYIRGSLVAENGKSLISRASVKKVNHFETHPKSPSDFAIIPEGKKIQVIEALDGQLITNSFEAKPKVESNNVVSDIEQDILKITVVNRYEDAPPAIGFIKNFGLREGAIASSIAHDSHNIVAVGVTDKDICQAVNGIISAKGGIAVVKNGKANVLSLPVAGIMSNSDGYLIAEQYALMDKQAKELGTALQAPFMTLSFMALLVIPSLKLSDKGLFDGTSFQFCQLFG